MMPKGKLLIIGGAEAEGDNEFLDVGGINKEFKRYEILKEILFESKNKKIEIITTASRVPEEIRRTYKNAFRDIDYPDPGFIRIDAEYEAEEERYISRIKEASAVFFTGGDQSRLVDILNGTKLIEIIKKKYQNSNFLVAGTSAGAMAVSSVMIAEGGREEALFNKDLDLSEGLGLLPCCIVDTHFLKRGRFARLAHAIVLNPDKLGIGLGEDTALIISNGKMAECRGSGSVVIIDGKNIGKTNVKSADENEAVYAENLKVDLLVKGCGFNFDSRKMEILPKELISDR